ncbi:MAG: hypothetical protein AAES65_21955 [Candidatus Thiodiazotropha sp. (ex. Lucinoma kazani)]
MVRAGDRVITHGTDKARVGEIVKIKGTQEGGLPIQELLKPVAKAAKGET